MNVKLKRLREQLNLSESQISSLLNISSYKYRRFENNSMMPTCGEIVLLSIMYDIPIDYLILDSFNVNNILDLPQVVRLTGLPIYEILQNMESNLCAYCLRRCHHINYRYIKQILNRMKTIMGANLYDLRVEQGLSVFELSEQLNLSVESYSAFEEGKSFPSVSDLVMISMFFNIPIQQILTEKTQDVS